jgi:asparagine synthase (glutamine-hydrolysing)
MFCCVCGQISLRDKKLSQLSSLNTKLIFSNPKGSAVFYQLGKDSNINLINIQQGVAIVVGNVFSPLKICSTFKKSIVANENAAVFNLKDMDGNFVLISIIGEDDGTSQITIASDNFGTRMALYFQQNDLLFFSTHISGMRFLLKDQMPPIAEDSLLHFYHFGFTANDRTLFAGINKVPPGSRLLISGQKVKLEKYFDLWDLYKPNEYINMNENEITERINVFMSEAIINRNPLKQPIALTLSGGVDSGFIAKKCRQAGIEVNGYNLAYGKDYNEFSRVDTLVKELNIRLNKLIATPEMMLQSVEAANSVGSEPVKFNDAAMRLLAIEAKKDGFGSVWDGDGADRLFFGMNRQMQYFKLFRLYKKLIKIHSVHFLAFISSKMKSTEWMKLNILLNNWERGIPAYPERKIGKIKKYNEELEKSIFELGAEKYWQEYIKKQSTEDLILYFTFQAINMCPEMFFHPPAEQQAALGLSAVSPFWDTNLVSLAVSIPSSLKIKKGKTKYILRKAAAMGQDQKYWRAPKIGLQDAFKFFLQSEFGKNWRNEGLKQVRESAEFSRLSSSIPDESIDPDSLLVLNLWKQINKIG